MPRSVRLRSLSARGFRTLRAVSLDFPEEGVVFVRSRNTLTGTTSGCGKTALLSAIGYALDFGPPTTSVASWDIGSVQVELALVVDDVSVTVRRGSEGCEVLVAGEEPRRGRQAAAWIREVVGVPAMARAASWREQRSGGNFFCLRPAEKARFLVSVLGLDHFEREAQAAAKLADRAAGKVDERRRQVDAGEAALRQRQADLEACVPDPVPVESARLAVEGAALDLSELLDLHASAQDAVSQATEAHARELQDRAALTSMHREASAVARNAQREHDALAARVAAQEGPCPTCGATRRHQVEGLRQRHEEAAVRLESARADLAQIEEILRDVPSPAAIAEAQATAREVGGLVSEAQERHRRADRALAAATAAHEQQLAKRKTLEGDVQRLAVALEQSRTDLRDAEATEQRERDFALLAGKRWQRSVLDEVLAEVTAETNRVLARVPNTAECSVVFEAVDRGEERDVLQRLYVQGVERGDDAFSGGQRSSAELAADLAVAAVVQARGVARLLWMALDEPFDGMGAVDRAAFVEILEERGGLFLVTAHEPEFAEAFRLRGVGVEFDGDSARIVSESERATAGW